MLISTVLFTFLQRYRQLSYFYIGFSAETFRAKKAQEIYKFLWTKLTRGHGELTLPNLFFCESRRPHASRKRKSSPYCCHADWKREMKVKRKWSNGTPALVAAEVRTF